MDAVPFDVCQQAANEKFYKSKGVAFNREFKTFASDLKFAMALAIDFSKRINKKDGKTVKIYEFGVGDGSLGTRFLLELRKISSELSDNVIYYFCDFSEELVKNASRRADAFGFNAEAIAYDTAKGNPRFLVNPDYIIINEFYDDLPAKMLMRGGKEMMGISISGKERIAAPFEGDEKLKNYMTAMPEGYRIPLNVVAKNHLDFCASRLGSGSCIDIFDYGFRNAGEIRETPADMWNNSIIREFGGQITTDVNFDFISQGLNAKIEAQLDFVQRALGEKLCEVEMDRLRYLNEKEIKCSKRQLAKYGYPPGFEKMHETRGYLHMRVKQ